ncbi:MAG: fibronectin type III domain-containing protein [Bradymonadales bacterium]|jgi:hypothetical protein
MSTKDKNNEFMANNSRISKNSAFSFAFYFVKLALCTAVVLALPLQALAATTAKDWTMSSSLTKSDKDSENRLSFNIQRCRDLFDISTEELTLIFSLNAQALPSANAQFSIKFAKNHESCDKNSLERGSDACELIIEKQSLKTSTSPIEVRKAVNSLSSAETADACAGLEESSYLYLIVNEPRIDGTEQIYTVTYTLDFRSTRPPAPTAISAQAGESTISVSWTAAPNTTEYTIYYCPEGSTMSSGQAPETLSGCKSITSAKTSATIKSNLAANTNYLICVVSNDKAGNQSLIGEVVTVSTKDSDDFWESYLKENQDSEGGFCFIATAAWGTPQEPHVATLRKFRDEKLMKTHLGRAFVKKYYELSPPLAIAIRNNPALAAFTRLALWPAVALASLSLYAPIGAPIALGFALLLCAAFIAYRRKSAATMALLAAICASAVAAPQNAIADESHVNMMIELKAGPYTPTELGAAFDTHFDGKTGYLVEAEYDYQLYRGIGSLGIGFHLGYGAIKGNAVDSAGEPSVDETAISWLPLRISLVYRMDWLWLNLNIPFTFYGKIGFDYVFWWVTDGSGQVANAGGQSGAGGTFGWHGVAGAAFVLDWLAPGMAKSFDVEWGVNNSYIFAEFLYADINNFGTKKSLNLKDKATFLVGLALEF